LIEARRAEASVRRFSCWNERVTGGTEQQ